MRTRFGIALAACALGVSVALADGQEQGVMQTVAFDRLTWQRIAPELGEDSPEVAAVDCGGDAKVTRRFVRAPRRIHVPRHTHASTEAVIVVRGAATFACDRCGEPKALGVGDIAHIPGECVHQAWLEEGTVLFVTLEGPWDLTWVAGPPTAANLDVEAPRAK
jgi:quercetin dioxygenase-like cupin family protein